MEGINAAKARGVYKGRKPRIKADEFGACARMGWAPRLLPRSSAYAVRVCSGS